MGSFSTSKAYIAAVVLFKCSFSGTFQCGTEFAVGNTFENLTPFSVAGPRVTRGTHAEHQCKPVPLGSLSVSDKISSFHRRYQDPIPHFRPKTGVSLAVRNDLGLSSSIMIMAGPPCLSPPHPDFSNIPIQLGVGSNSRSPNPWEGPGMLT